MAGNVLGTRGRAVTMEFHLSVEETEILKVFK